MNYFVSIYQNQLNLRDNELFEYFATSPKITGIILSAVTAIGSIIAAALTAYLVSIAKNLATRRDAANLQKALEENTAITKSVEQKFSQADYFMKRELDFRERQLSSLYGPVYGYLKSQEQIYDLWINGNMNDKNILVKQLFAKQNDIVRQIIVANVHLIESDKMQDYISRFFTSSQIFDWYAASSEDGQVPAHLARHAYGKYPKEFDEHFFVTTEWLKARVQALNNQFAYPLNLPLPTDSKSA